MDLLDDLISGAPVAKVSRFKPKAKGQPKKAPSKTANSNVGNATKEQPATSDLPLSVQSDVSVKETSKAPTSSSPTETKDTIDLSTTTTEHPETPAPDVSTIQNDEIPVFPDVSFAHQDSEDFQINVEQLEAGDFSCLDEIEEMNEAGGTSGKKASKFKPKPKPKPKPHDIANDQSQNAVFEDTESLMTPDMSEQRGKDGNLNDLNAPDNQPDEGPVMSGVEANDTTYEFVDGANDNVHINNKSPTRSHDELGSNREENDNGEHLEAEKSKKRVRRSKKAVSENDKPSRKRKVSQEPDKTMDKPPKKFPRATRRKRCVDKTLLEVPEDELDFHKLPIKDLILLAEYKERETKKQATSGQQQSTTERIDNMQSEAQPYDDDALDFDQDRDLSENPSTSGIQTDTGYYNYHSFRKIQPRAKWSKKDTEMFYQGIRQFGTDLSMIQQLFPGRSLEQIRSKYKKEQKQNPMMMDDAQATRATDNSCFELVIKTLEAAREAEKEYGSSDDDDFVQPTGKEAKPEDNIETHATKTQEAGNSEQNHKDEAASEEPDRPLSPVITYDDDDDGWDTYIGI